MKDSLQQSLPPWLRALPVGVLELNRATGAVVESNGRLDGALRCELVGAPLDGVLDAVSRDKLRRLLNREVPLEPGARVELTVERGEVVEALAFFVVSEGDRVWLVEVARDPRQAAMHDALTELNAELVNTQRELAKKSGRLGRALEEIEDKLRENEQLSQMLQYQNEEMEAQNEELLAMTEELHSNQHELLDLNQLLERKTRELQVALSARNRFYAAMSHELRTPINAVMGYNDLLLAGIYGPLAEQQELAVERAQRAVGHLRELVNDVLDISKIESGRMELEIEEVDLRALVQELFTTLEPMSAAQGTTMAISCWECPRTLFTDPRRLRQILLNLLGNAIKYGGGKPVWVQCTRVPSGDLALEVVDNGDGIAPEDLAAIFEEFVQLGTQPGGTGLGLPIARRLALLLGGRLEASSTVGTGSTFRLTLPLHGPTDLVPAISGRG